MTNTHAMPFDLIGWRIVRQATTDVELRIELEIAGLRHEVQGHGSTRIAAFADAARHVGVHVAVPHREVHDWDGSTGTVTSSVICLIDGIEVAGAATARERGEATMRAMLAAAHAAAMRTGVLQRA